MSLSQIMDKSKTPGVNLVVNSITTFEPLVGVCNSLQSLSGDIAMVSPQNTISILVPNAARRSLGATSSAVQNIEFEYNGSLNGLVNNINIISPDSSITIVTDVDENTIALQAVGGGGGVSSLDGLTGAITLQSDDNSISFNNPSGQIIDLVVNFPTPTATVNALNSLTGDVTLTSPSGTITITPNGQNIELTAVGVGSGVQSVSAGTGGVTITGTATDPIVNIPAIPTSTLVISDYTNTAGTLALTGTFATQGSTTLTTTQDAAPINIWGNLNVFHPTGGGGGAAVVEARLVIGTTTPQIGPTITTTVDNGHYQTIPLLYKAVGRTPAASVNIFIEARVTSGNVNRVSAQVMAIGQMLNA